VRSVLRLRLPPGSVVARYELVSANDNPARDPASWAFGTWDDAKASFTQLSHVALPSAGVALPGGRYDSP
jgi:hypothetical protein